MPRYTCHRIVHFCYSRYIRKCRPRLLKDMETEYLCECGKKYNAQRNLIYHKRTVHNQSPSSISKSFPCVDGCPNTTYSSLADLRNHYVEKHDYKDDTESLTFKTLTEFLSWKADEERKSKSSFCITSGKKRLAGGGIKSHYVCNRSGTYKPRGKGLRQLKIQGSCKMDARCLASVEVLEAHGQVTAVYHKNHYGHSHDFAHLVLSQNEKAEIAAKLASGVNMQRILDDVRNSIGGGELERIHLISRHDLHNIKMEYSINSEENVRHHMNDKLSVGIWVDKMNMLESSPIILFKQQGDEDPTGVFQKKDFVLSFMLHPQMVFLQKLGPEKICIDSTHGTSGHDFQLTTVLSIDEYSCGFPCAFCISNRIDTNTYKAFFTAVKNKAGIISTKVLMSDDAAAIYNAWEAVMGKPGKQLLCSWHVDKNWRNKIREIIKEKSLQAMIYKTVRTLMEELNEEKFVSLMDAFIASLEEQSHKETGSELERFKIYFVNTYAKRPESWAYCYRKHVGINTNMYIESMHRVLKYCYLDGKQNRRVDTCIQVLLKFTRDKLFDRLIKLTKGNITHRISLIRQRHATGQGIPPTDVMLNGNVWKVKSQSIQNTEYVVKEEKKCDPGSCNLKCTACDVCVHAYSCTCTDYTIHFNMCKHIHAVVQLHKMSVDAAVQLHKKKSADVLLETSENHENQGIDDPAMLLKSIESTVIDCQRDAEITVNSNLHLLRVIMGLVEGRKLGQKDSENLNHLLSNFLSKLDTEKSYCNKNIPHKKIEKQGRFFSTKAKRNQALNLAMTKPTEAEKHNIATFIEERDKETIFVNSGSDHLY